MADPEGEKKTFAPSKIEREREREREREFTCTKYYLPLLFSALEMAIKVRSAVEFSVTVVWELSMTRFFSDVKMASVFFDW